MLKATTENLQIRGSREILRRMDTSALVSIGAMAAAAECCGAKLISTFTFNGVGVCRRVTGGSSLKNSRSDASITPGAIGSFIPASLPDSAAEASQVEEHTRSMRSR